MRVQSGYESLKVHLAQLLRKLRGQRRHAEARCLHRQVEHPQRREGLEDGVRQRLKLCVGHVQRLEVGGVGEERTRQGWSERVAPDLQDAQRGQAVEQARREVAYLVGADVEVLQLVEAGEGVRIKHLEAVIGHAQHPERRQILEDVDWQPVEEVAHEVELLQRAQTVEEPRWHERHAVGAEAEEGELG